MHSEILPILINDNVHEFTDYLSHWVSKLAPLPIDFLIEGETGTGKDTFARLVYEASELPGPFIGINCAAIPEGLAEAELFGSVQGAYTGAPKARVGHIEAANNGILYLDEIDSMPLSLQAKLLRVLETRSVMRLGATDTTQVNVRVIGAAQRPLAELVEEGAFRADLFFRLTTVKLSLPALRDRVDSIVPGFRRFSIAAAKQFKVDLPAMDETLAQNLLLHSWPGNMRELKAAAMRFVLGLDVLGTNYSTGKTTLKDRLSQFETCIIQDTLTRHDNQVHVAAFELGIPTRTLYNKLKALNLMVKTQI